MAVIKLKRPRITAAALSCLIGVSACAFAPKVDKLDELNRKLIEIAVGESGIIRGDGSEDAPWLIEKREKSDTAHPARVLYLDDDPEGYFEEVPPPPIDWMVITARLKDAGVETMGIAYPLAWNDPDTLALETMRSSMDEMQRVVLGFVVKDSNTTEPVPRPLLAASMPVNSVSGEASKLPIVNRIRGSVNELGGKNSWGGFLRIESETPKDDRVHLLARWSDRVIFSLPLAMEISRLGLDPQRDVEIYPGREIRLGKKGPRIPIDIQGCMLLDETETKIIKAQATAVVADALPEEFIQSNAPLYLTDERILGEKENRIWAERIGSIDASIRMAERATGQTVLERFKPLVEYTSLVVVALVGSALLGFRFMPLRVLTLILYLGAIAAILAWLFQNQMSASPAAFLTVPLVLLIASLLLDIRFPDKHEETDTDLMVPERSPFATEGIHRRNRKRSRSGLPLRKEKSHDGDPEKDEPEKDNRESRSAD